MHMSSWADLIDNNVLNTITLFYLSHFATQYLKKLTLNMDNVSDSTSWFKWKLTQLLNERSMRWVLYSMISY